MKKITFILAVLLPTLALAGAYEDMEEALIRGDTGAAVDLIKRGMSINTVDRTGNSLLMQSIQRDVPGLFEYLMKRRVRLNVRNKNGETALSIAAYTGKMDYVKPLVEAGAEVNFYGWPPLSYAAYNGHVEIVEYLLARGADIDGKTENGSTALFFAARFDHMPVIKVLLANNADPKIANDADETAVDWALKGQNTDIADLLRAAGGRSGKTLVLEFGK